MRCISKWGSGTAGPLLLFATFSLLCFVNPVSSLPNLVGDCESELFTGLSDWDNGDDSTMMYDDGTHGDETGGDNIYTLKVEGAADTFLLAETVGHQVVGTAGQWDPQFPGQNVPIEFLLGDTITFYLDRNAYTDGFVPESCIVYNSWMESYSWPGPHYVVGDCQTEFGAPSDWNAADTTMKMNDSGVNGDAAAGDLVYTFRGVCSAAGNYQFKVVNSYDSWRPQYAQEGFVWDFGNNLLFSTQSNADTVTFETDISKGRTRVTIISGLDTLNPRVEEATVVSWDSVKIYFSEPMDSTSAVNSAYYDIYPYLPVLSVQWLSSSQYQLFLGTPKQIQAGTNYTVTVDTLVKDLAGNPMDTLYNTGTFGIAPVTFQVIDTVSEDYPGFLFKGSFDTLELHNYDATWGLGYLYEMYDDGTHGDAISGDHIWSNLLYLVPDGGANTWEWGVTDTFEIWIAGNWQFWVSDASPQTLSFEPDPGTSQNVQVSFSVDMGGQDPLSYAGGVSLEGSRWPLDWDAGNTPMTDPDDDTVYTVAITFPTGSYPWVDYKYTKSTNGITWDWESTANRTFGIDDSAPTQTLPLDCFNNVCPTSDTAVTVSFTYDCKAWADSIQQGVWLIGSQPPLAFGDPCPDTNNPMNDLGDWIYQLWVTFPAGTQKYIEFKAVIDADTSCWDEAELPGSNRHFILDDSDTIQILDTLYYNNEIMEEGSFIRGDADGSGVLTLGDGIQCFRCQFVPGWSDSCRCDDAMDANDNGAISIGDCLRILRKQFVPGWQDSIPDPCCSAPEDCAPDPTLDDLGCDEHPGCGTLKITPKQRIIGGELIPGTTTIKDGIIILPVYLYTDRELSGFAYTISYDPSILSFISLETESLITEPFDFVSALPDQGQIAVGAVVSFDFTHRLPKGNHHVTDLVFKVEQWDRDIRLRFTDAELVDVNARSLSATLSDVVVKGLPRPIIFRLSQNYPNPVKGGTLIRYQLPKSAHTTLTIYNLAGQVVKTLVDKVNPPGYYSVLWDGKDEDGRRVASGIYFYRLDALEFTSTRKLVAIK